MMPRSPLSPIGNARGSVLVVALLILVVVTIIGVAALTTSSTERLTSANFLLYERAFYTAEAGMEHVKEGMRNALREPARLASLATTGRANWSFLLTGATATTYDGGVKWISNQPLDIYRYTVTIWDNDDGDGKPAVDADGIVHVRAEATGPLNSRCSIQTILDANVVTNPIMGYNAQDGSGSGKSYVSSDKNAVDFSKLKVQIGG